MLYSGVLFEHPQENCSSHISVSVLYGTPVKLTFLVSYSFGREMVNSLR